MTSTLYTSSIFSYKINTRKFFSLSFSFLFVVYLLIFFSKFSIDSISYYSISIIVVISLLENILLTKINGHKIISFLTLFIVFYYLFHFGQVIMLGLFPNYNFDYLCYLNTFMTSNEIILKTIKVSLLCINFFTIGAIIVNKPKLGNEKKSKTKRTNIGKYLLIVLLPFRLFYDFRVLYYSIGGYSNTFNISFFGGGIISALAIICPIAAMIYYLELNPKRDKLFFRVSILYLFFTMLSGGRGHSLIAIIGLFVVYFTKHKIKITFFKAIKWLILSCLVLFFIDIIYDMRQVGIFEYLKNFSTYLSQGIKKNILLETIGSFGETIFTPYLVIEEYGSAINPFFGECFVKSIFSILPDGFSSFSQINNEAIFVKMLNSNFALGGSFVGDLYYNFGNYYWVFSLVIGFIYSKCSCKFTYYVTNNNHHAAYYYLPFLCLSMWWIRDSVGGLTRNVVWCMILIFLMRHFVVRRKGVNKN